MFRSFEVVDEQVVEGFRVDFREWSGNGCCSGILLPELFAQTAQNNESEYGGEGGAGWKVEPDTDEAEGPKEDEEEYGEGERCGDGDERGLEWLADGDHVALGGEAEPACEISEAEEAEGGGCGVEELLVGIGHKEMDDERRLTAHEEHQRDGCDGGTDETAALDGAHAAVFPRAPVVADGRLEGVADAV